jgi:8-oxo-dGTP pyrophosphatase MutT (NUDIX family)
VSLGPYLAKLRAAFGHEKVLVPGVGAIIQNERGEVLLQDRVDHGVWGFPGGTVEMDETVLEALGREVKEETGLSVVRPRLLGLYTGPRYDTHYPNGDVLQNFCVFFHVIEWTGTVQADRVEGHRLEFFRTDGLPVLLSWHTDVMRDFAAWDGRVIIK